MLDHYRMFADYNRWANRRVYAAVSELSDSEYREDKGAFFGSLHGTLNHILAADRIWMKRFTKEGEAPSRLDAILHEDFTGLAAARAAEDDRIIAWVDSLDEARLAGHFTYSPLTNPVEVTERLARTLAHFFNHQTHHRGQAHATLTALRHPSLTLDLVFFLRTEGKKWAD
ncbi:DinB family protein [Sinorhizobium meliloti]|uniref:DinB family protein n=1 Tax=Rhizobium meliloti TaxID=382 RepID=UPI002D77063D|nr:DinB family protein [Sinorhizobium meliloti]WRQ68703.1 DinB family protein [Sinorhizobium meliloti]